jgi:hypothetical protein
MGVVFCAVLKTHFWGQCFKFLFRIRVSYTCLGTLLHDLDADPRFELLRNGSEVRNEVSKKGLQEGSETSVGNCGLKQNMNQRSPNTRFLADKRIHTKEILTFIQLQSSMHDRPQSN